MEPVHVRPELSYIWYGPALLITDVHGEAGAHELSGFYFRETRFLRTLRLRLDGEEPWTCAMGHPSPEEMLLGLVHPELPGSAGGGSDVARDELPRNPRGIPRRAFDLMLRYRLGFRTLAVELAVSNCSPERHELEIEAEDVGEMPDSKGEAARHRHCQQWYDRLTRVAAPGDQAVARVVNHAMRDLGSLALLEGERDEWLAPSAGIPLYPALFGRDAVTATWQVAALDRGELLDASLSRLQRCQGMHVDPALDEEPGRIVQQVRR